MADPTDKDHEAVSSTRTGDETAAEQAEAAADPAEQADAPLHELQREKEALQDRLLRTAAEFDNYRKRVERERRELAESAASDLLLELLPIVDNLERALQAPGAPEADGYRKGVELILKQMTDLLRRRHVTTIDTGGVDFDPQVHEAVMHEPSERHRDGEVIAELQRGYRLGERLLRPAMVKVAKRP